MTTDTSEKGLESIIVADMEAGGWLHGNAQDFEREYAIDLAQLHMFLKDTQPDFEDSVNLVNENPSRSKFLARVQGEITSRGIIDVLRTGIKHGPYNINMFYGTPSAGNVKAQELFRLNRFSVTRQLRYSRDEAQLALDLCIFINGLPIATFELKNSLTKQTVEDAVTQYKRDRDSRELLFQFGRCIAHFAVDDTEVSFCTHLNGKQSWFLPFNKGWNDGAGNPPNPDGIMTDYLWKQILSPGGLTDVLENYAQLIEFKDLKTGQKNKAQVFPRYHQLSVVRELLKDAKATGAGRRYLVEHSAGSGKSNSIAWLAHQLIDLRTNGSLVFDSIIVVTDRVILDKQLNNTIKQYTQVKSTVGHAAQSGDLKKFIEDGKKVIVSTVQKFPHILDEISSEHRSRRFAIIIDEAHSSQGGRTAAALNMSLSADGAEEQDESIEDLINRLMESKKLLPNASYFAFTATPKNKTLELFGEQFMEGEQAKFRPFHIYTMKQAIDEGFILDVLQNYTPVESYYKLIKTIPGDPEFDSRKAQKKLRHYVESHDRAIKSKAEIMVDHFIDEVIGRRKIGGQARAMVVTSGIKRAVQYYEAISTYLKERKSEYKAIVAFSGEHEYGGKQMTEAAFNGFPSKDIEDQFVKDPYRILVCADKFQTGYDEPLLHTMYVDKVLSGVRAVQTLSRLNRAHPQKHDVFVLDFMNDVETIRASFEPYYRTTILSEETDPNKLHDLKAKLDGHGVYSQNEIDDFVQKYLQGAERPQLDPILDACVAMYIENLDEDGQVDFKSAAKSFNRAYGFLSAILPYSNADWERLSIFLNFLVPKLPAPVEEDLSKGILETIDMDSYRVEKKAALAIQLANQDGEVEPVPTGGGGGLAEPEIDLLSNIVKTFNEQFGNITWTNADRIHKMITEEIPERVQADVAYQNAKKQGDPQNARIEHDNALKRVMSAVMKDDTELFKQFVDNDSFRRWLTDTVFNLTYNQ